MKEYSLILQSVSHAATDSLTQLTSSTLRIYSYHSDCSKYLKHMLAILLHFNRHAQKLRLKHCYIVLSSPLSSFSASAENCASSAALRHLLSQHQHSFS